MAGDISEVDEVRVILAIQYEYDSLIIDSYNLPPMEDIAGNNPVKHYSAGLTMEIRVFLLAALGMANANANASAIF